MHTVTIMFTMLHSVLLLLPTIYSQSCQNDYYTCTPALYYVQANQNDCSRFVRCEGGNPQYMQCRRKYVYDFCLQKCTPILNACDAAQECFCVQNRNCVIQKTKGFDINQADSDLSTKGIPKWSGLPAIDGEESARKRIIRDIGTFRYQGALQAYRRQENPPTPSAGKHWFEYKNYQRPQLLFKPRKAYQQPFPAPYGSFSSPDSFGNEVMKPWYNYVYYPGSAYNILKDGQPVNIYWPFLFTMTTDVGSKNDPNAVPVSPCVPPNPQTVNVTYSSTTTTSPPETEENTTLINE